MGNRRSLCMLVIALVIATTFAGSSSAQVIYGQPTSGDLSVSYQSWTVKQGDEETTISQFAIPLGAFVPVQDNFDISLYVANATSTLETATQDFSLGGLSDVRMQANHSFANDQLLFSVGLNLPTGKKALDLTEEYFVLQALSANYLDFPIRRYGEGFGFNLLFAGATVLGDNVRGGAGIMYQYAGSYQPYDGFTDYDPGDVISVNAGLDIGSAPMSWTIDIVYSTFTTDQIDGIKTFKQSSQLDTRLSARYVGEQQMFAGYVGYLMRGDNTQYVADGDELDPFKLYGNEFLIAGRYVRQFGAVWHAGPSVELRLIGGNDLDMESSSVFGVGASIGRELGSNLAASGGFKYYSGSADGGDIDLSGYQITFGLTATR